MWTSTKYNSELNAIKAEAISSCIFYLKKVNNFIWTFSCSCKKRRLMIGFQIFHDISFVIITELFMKII